MRAQFGKISQGGSDMKSLVAGLLVLTFVSGIIVQGQTPPRSANKTANKPRSDAMKICQGVPIPDGYVAIAYMTSAACPHGAYLLKKQDQYEASLAINGAPRPSLSGEDTSSRNTKPVTSSGRQMNRTQPARSSSQSKTTDNQVPAQSAAPGPQAAAVTRPRRVGVALNPQVTAAQTTAAIQQI